MGRGLWVYVLRCPICGREFCSLRKSSVGLIWHNLTMHVIEEHWGYMVEWFLREENRKYRNYALKKLKEMFGGNYTVGYFLDGRQMRVRELEVRDLKQTLNTILECARSPYPETKGRKPTEDEIQEANTKIACIQAIQWVVKYFLEGTGAKIEKISRKEWRGDPSKCL